MAVRSEVARLEGSPLAGLSADLAKLFDLVDPHIAIDLLEELGLPKEIVGPLRHFYDHLWRIMTLNGVAGEGFRSAQAVLQGCAWSNPLTLALGTLWADYVEHCTKAHAMTYADDWYLLVDRFSKQEPRPVVTTET